MRWKRRITVVDAHAEGENGRVITGGVLEVAGRPAIVPRITGSAWIFASHEFGLDPEDPFPEGFTLSDIWGSGMRGNNP